MDKLEIIRNLEYINGGIRTLQKLYTKEDNFLELLDEWSVIIDQTLDELTKEDDVWPTECNQR